MEWALIASILSVIFGGVSATTGSLPFIKSSSRYETMKKSLAKAMATKESDKIIDKRRKDAKLQNKDHWTYLIEWLDYGDLIVLALRRKIFSRLLTLTGVAVVSIASIYVNPPNYLLSNDYGRLEAHDIIIGFVPALYAYFSLLKHNLMSEEEFAFLKNINNLYNAYYNEIITPRIKEFNEEFKLIFKKYEQCFETEAKFFEKNFQYYHKKIIKKMDKINNKSSKDHETK